MISSRDQRRIFLLPGKTRSVSESRLQDISTVIKQVQQSRPIVPTNPDRSCTYLCLRAHPDEHSVQLKPSLKLPRGGAAKASSSDQHLDKHWPGGLNKNDPRVSYSQGKGIGGRQMVKPMLGLAGKVLFKANCQGGPINHPTALGTQNPGT